MDEKIYLRADCTEWRKYPDGLARIIGRNPCYDLAGLPSPKLKDEIEGFIRYRSTQVSIEECRATNSSTIRCAGS